MNGGVFACAGRDEKDGKATDGGEERKDSTNGAIRKKNTRGQIEEKEERILLCTHILRPVFCQSLYIFSLLHLEECWFIAGFNRLVRKWFVSFLTLVIICFDKKMCTVFFGL